MPSATRWLRIASGLTLLFAAGHAMGAIDSWSPSGETDVLRSMRAFEFDVSGTIRTYWHFYMGFGVYITVLMLMQAVVLWQMASLARVNVSLVRPLIGAVGVASLIGTAVIWAFIFAVPALLSLACTVCVGLAFVSASRTTRAEGVRPAT
jgi:hypothetical protein